MSTCIKGGDCRASMRGLPEGSIHACVTSIPYYALRSYGTEPQVWGGKAGCEHAWGEAQPGKRSRWGDLSTLSEKQASNGGSAAMVEALEAPGGSFCGHCDAWRGELGLEPSVDLYVEHVVEVFAEVWRVLRKDGTCWLNVADSYHGGGNRQSAEDVRARGDDRTWRGKPFGTGGGLKPKDLCLVPRRLALALQAAGWWVRCDCIWAKPNPMPESLGGWEWRRCRVKVAAAPRGQEPQRAGAFAPGLNSGSPQSDHNGREFAAAEWAPCPGCPRCEPNGGLVLCRDSGRPTKAHEYLFLLAKSGQYFWDAEAVKEKQSEATLERFGNGGAPRQLLGPKHQEADEMVRWESSGRTGILPSGRNIRSVWTINPQPFLGAHFATYPEELVRRCILASTSEAGCCPSCGAPYARVIEEGEPDRDWQRACGGDANGGWTPKGGKDWEAEGLSGGGAMKARILAGMRTRTTTGWRPTCTCAGGDPVPATVLDPFTGSGTTGLVAKKHGRSFIGCELKEDYAAMAEDRIGERGQRSLW